MHRLSNWVIWLILAGTTFAQSPVQGPAVAGVVRDPSGASVAGAKVTLKRTEGSETANAAADVRGAFRFDGLQQGNYEITVEYEGFKPSTTRVRIGARPPGPLTITLTIADVQSTVSVGDQDSQISTNSGDNLNAITLDRQALDNLPIFDQDFVGATSRFLDAGSIASGGVTVLVDGVEAPRAGISASAIQEVKINQDPYTAEYPRPGRGQIEIITKPGTAVFHGTFNFLFRDYRLNARDPFALTRPSEQRRIFEGSLTGPIGRSKKLSFVISANREEEDLQSVIFADGLTGPIRQTLPTPSRNTEFSGSFNRQIGDNHLISMRGVSTHRTIEGQGVGGLNLPGVATNFEDREDAVYFNHRGPLTKTFFSQFRFFVARQHTPTISVNPEPKIVVLGAFTGGGAQGDRLQTENHFGLTELIVWSGKKQTVRFGFNVPDFSRRGLDDNTNSIGTYTFSSLADYAQARPFSLLRQAGNVHLVFIEKVIGGFVQDEIRIRPNFQISLGLRYDWQNFFHDNNNFAPRASFAYAVGKNRSTVIRGGGGVYFDRTGPNPMFDLVRYDGSRLLQFLITNPSFPDPNATGPTSIVRLDPSVKIPYIVQYGVGVERQLRKSTTFAVNYYGTRGVNLLRARDVNAPPPPFYIARPNPNYAVWRQIESSADLEAHALEITLRGNVTRFFTGMAQYNLSRAYNNTGGSSLPGAPRANLINFPADSYDLTGEWSRADFDQRHRFNLLGTITPGRYFKLGVGLSFYSAPPYSMTTGRDDNHDGQANDRPAGVPRNSLHGPGYADVDVRWSRDFFLVRAKRDKGPTVTVGVDAFNVLNHVNYVTYVGNLSSPFFGKPVSALPPRRLQFSTRFRF